MGSLRLAALAISLSLTLALSLWGCRAESETSSPSGHAPIPGPTPVAGHGDLRVRVHVEPLDGQLPELAWARLVPAGHIRPVAELELRAEPHFELRAPAEGRYFLTLHSSDHVQVGAQVFADRPMLVEARLSPGVWPPSTERALRASLRLHGAEGELERRIVSFTPRTDEGRTELVHRFEPALAAEVERVWVELRGAALPGVRINGKRASARPQLDERVVWLEAPAPTDGWLRVELPDPLPKRVLSTHEIRYPEGGGAPHWSAWLADFRASVQPVLDRRARGADQVAAGLMELAADTRALVEAMPPGIERELIVASFVADVSILWRAGAVFENVRWGLDMLAPDAPAWKGHSLRDLARMVGDDPAGRAYLEAMLETHPDPVVHGSLLAAAADEAMAAGDVRTHETLVMTVREHYGDLARLREFMTDTDPARPLRPGAPMPEWSAPRLDGDGTLGSATFAGKPYVLELWGTWCGPCVADMELLHRGYARFNGLSIADPRTLGALEDPAVNFVSLSSAEAEGAIQRFRDERWPMPWQHGALEADAWYSLRDRLGVRGIPLYVLVDAEGQILEVGRAVLERETIEGP